MTAVMEFHFNVRLLHYFVMCDPVLVLIIFLVRIGPSVPSLILWILLNNNALSTVTVHGSTT